MPTSEVITDDYTQGHLQKLRTMFLANAKKLLYISLLGLLVTGLSGLTSVAQAENRLHEIKCFEKLLEKKESEGDIWGDNTPIGDLDTLFAPTLFVAPFAYPLLSSKGFTGFTETSDELLQARFESHRARSPPSVG